eukprot:scaffold10.g2352.t1
MRQDVAALTAAVEALPSPPALLYDSAAGSAAPTAAAFLARTAAQLRAVDSLLQSIDTSHLGLQAWLERGEARHASAQGPHLAADEAAGPVGSVRIEELSSEAADAATGIDVCARLLLAVAHYGAEPAHEAAAAAACAPRPWAAPPASQAAAEALAGLTRKAAQAGATNRKQGHEGHQLVAAALPDLIQLLRPTILAHQQHEASDQSRLEPYMGPDAYERCLAAAQLSWLLRQLDGAALVGLVGASLPCVLACAGDSSPAVQAQGLWALHHLACEAPLADLQFQRELLLDAARRSLAGCDGAAWPAAAAAAAALARALDDARVAGASAPPSALASAPASAAVLEALLEEGERSGHVAPRAETWLRHAPTIFPQLGLHLVRYFARLMPLLLRWCAAPLPSAASGAGSSGAGSSGTGVQALALTALHGVMLQTWPRMPAHAPAIWRALAAAYDVAASSSSGDSGVATASFDSGVATASFDKDVQEWVIRCGAALWHCAGVDFQCSLLVGAPQRPDQQGGREQQQQLLEAVMARVEQDSSAAVDAALAEAAERRRREEQQQAPSGSMAGTLLTT